MRIRIGRLGGMRWLAPIGFAALGLGLGLGLASGPKPVEARPVRTAVEAYFSPGGGAELAIQRSIDGARGEVLCAVYILTSRRLALALKRARARGVQVRVITDRSTTRMRVSKAKELETVGIPIRYAALGYTGDRQPIKFHHKYAVIDRQKVITGSYNWTKQADTDNRENIVILYGKQIAKSFRANFEQEWTALKP